VCYSIYLSTNSDQDLSLDNSDLVHFKREPIPEAYQPILKYQYQWYVGSKSGCSCTFRHLFNVDLGFGAPVNWYQEDEDEIAATSSFIKFIRKIVNEGYRVDCLDIWEGAAPESIQLKVVDLGEVPDEQFRFFDNHHFLFEDITE
jgi:hypothetical protein